MTEDLDAIIRARMATFMEPDSPERIAERKRNSARCGHVKRKLRKGERLTGELLEFAVDVAGDHTEIVENLKAGHQLGDYEMHLMIDVFLLHARLA